MTTRPEDDAGRLEERLEAALRARDALLAGLAHDLRNPLNTFSMSVGLLRDDAERGELDPTRTLGLVQRMERATSRMQRLIDDLAEASRVDEGRLALTKSPADLGELLRESATALSRFADRSTRILVEEPERAVVVAADRSRLVLAVSKAAQFVLRVTGEGGVLTLSAATEDAKARVRVRGQTASGKVPTTPLPDEGRGGLSMLIARGITLAHGGTLELVDATGAELAIELPIEG